MSYIAFDLDALNVAPAVARAAGITEDCVIAGLTRLWAWCFRSATEHVTRVHVRGFFGSDCTDALTAFGFLSTDSGAPSDQLRVRGADRYSRVTEARSRGGKMAAGNLKRGTQKPTTSRDTSPGSLPAPAGDQPGDTPGFVPALTPSTEHRTPSTEHHEQAPIAVDGASTFFVWAQDERHQTAGLVREKPPHPRSLSAWCNEAMLQTGGDFDRLKAGYRAFLLNPFWRNEARVKCAWTGWVSQWRDFVPSTAEPIVTERGRRDVAPPSNWSTETTTTVSETF